MNMRAPARAAALPVEDFYGQEDDERPGNQGQGGADDGREAPDDSAFEDGQEGEGGQEGDDEVLGADDADDFFSPPPSRGQHRQQTLANENRDLRRQLDELRGVRPAAASSVPAAPTQETDAQFEARIQLLGFEERMEARYRRDREIQGAQLNQTRLETAIAQDRTAYQTRAATDKRFKRWEERVEAEFNRRKQMGQLVSRMDILKWMLGDRMVDGDGAPAREERGRAERRVNRERTRPVNAGSDVRPQRRGQLSEREQRARRLEGQQI